MATTPAPTHSAPSGTSASTATAPNLATDALAHYARFEDVVELIRTHRDVKLLVEVETGLRLASYQPGRIEFTPSQAAPNDLAQRLGSRLQAWTGNRWVVTVTPDSTAPTIAETRDAKDLEIRKEAETHPLVQAVVAAFPKAKITEIRTQAEAELDALSDALPEVDEEWDPFDDA